jgi:hypothetical protein
MSVACDPTNEETPPTPPLTDVTLVAMLDQDTPVNITGRRETDTTTALTRGLKEYLAQAVKGQAVDGRVVDLKATYDHWPETEDLAAYPALAVYSTEAGKHDTSSFTVNTRAEGALPDGERYAFASEFVLNLIVELWTVDPEERLALCALIEDALYPVDWMYGARLILPHYHGVQADYTLLSTKYIDSADDAKRRWRVAQFSVEGRLPTVKVFGNIPPLAVSEALNVGVNLQLGVTEQTVDPLAGLGV